MKTVEGRGGGSWKLSPPLAAAAAHDKHDVAYLQERADWMMKKSSSDYKKSSDFESTNFDIDTKSQSLYPNVQYGIMSNTKKRAQSSSTKADNKALIKKIKEKLLNEKKDSNIKLRAAFQRKLE